MGSVNPLYHILGIFGQVPMKHVTGSTWRATLGPFPSVGDGTVDYQVRAVDNLGNESATSFSQIGILACIP